MGEAQTLLTFFACCTCSICGRNVASPGAAYFALFNEVS